MRTATMFLLGPMLTGFVLCESVQRLGQVRRASRLPLTVPCSRLRCLNSSCPIGQVTRPSGWRMKQLTMLCRCTPTEMVVPPKHSDSVPACRHLQMSSGLFFGLFIDFSRDEFCRSSPDHYADLCCTPARASRGLLLLSFLAPSLWQSAEPFASFLNRKEAVLRAQAMSLWMEPASPVTEERKPFVRPGYAHVRGAETVARSMSSTSNTRTSAGVSRHSI